MFVFTIDQIVNTLFNLFFGGNVVFTKETQNFVSTANTIEISPLITLRIIFVPKLPIVLNVDFYIPNNKQAIHRNSIKHKLRVASTIAINSLYDVNHFSLSLGCWRSSMGQHRFPTLAANGIVAL